MLYICDTVLQLGSSGYGSGFLCLDYINRFVTSLTLLFRLLGPKCPLIGSLTRMQWIPQIHLWCDDTSGPFGSKHWSWVFFCPYTFSSIDRIQTHDWVCSKVYSESPGPVYWRKALVSSKKYTSKIYSNSSVLKTLYQHEHQRHFFDSKFS